MRVFLTCDDGIDAIGINILVKILSEIFDVVVFAPDRERSTSSHSMTIHKPLRIFKKAENQYAVSGTPADCIYVGIRLFGRPDLVVSGINHGANLGTDIFYSGTVAGAREAAFMNIKSYSFSVTCHPFSHVPIKELEKILVSNSQNVRKVIEKTINEVFPPYSYLNVNIPYLDSNLIKGIKVTTQAIRIYGKELIKKVDPFGGEYYWIGGDVLGYEGGKESDCCQNQENYITITPLKVDCTDRTFYEKLKPIFP